MKGFYKQANVSSNISNNHYEYITKGFLYEIELLKITVYNMFNYKYLTIELKI